MDENLVSTSTVLGEIEILTDTDNDCTVTCILTNVKIKRKHTKFIAGDSDNELEANCLTDFCEIEENLGNLQISGPKTDDITSSSETVETEYIIIDEREAMAAMGLPTAFGDKRKNKRNNRKARIGKEDFAKFVLPSLRNASYGVQTLSSAASIVQKMGYFYKPTASTSTNPSELEEAIGSNDEHLDSSAEAESDNSKDISVLTNLVEMNNCKNFKEADEILDLNELVNPDLINLDENQDESLTMKEVINEVDNVTRSDESAESSSEYSSAKSHLDEEITGSIANIKNKEKKRNRKKKQLPAEISENMSLYKYYLKRYTLFSLYDRGIQMDKEAWFSATPEVIAQHTAHRLRCDVVVDAFCGTGGNAIQFAKTCSKVIAIDIDPAKIEMAKHNASIYGVLDNIEFIVGDFIEISQNLKASVVFLSPPWGGPSYKANSVYDLEKHLQPIPASRLFELTKKITKNIALYLPRTSNTQQLIVLAGPGNQVELEQNYLFDQVTAITAYYGDLINLGNSIT